MQIVIPIPIDVAAVIVMGVGVLCWLIVAVDILRLTRARYVLRRLMGR